MKIGVLAITAGGRKLADDLVIGFNQAAAAPAQPAAEPTSPPAANGRPWRAATVPVEQGIAAALAAAWPRHDGLVCIMAAGIVVRAVAPLLADKKSDPAVVVVDEGGQFAVSLLSGHLGGGNHLARRVAALTGGQAVITTASDVLQLTPLDLWARTQNLVAAAPQAMTTASARLVNHGRLRVYSETAVAGLPPGLLPVTEPEAADLIISCRTEPAELTAIGIRAKTGAKIEGKPQFPLPTAPPVIFHPRQLVVGIGCNRGTPAAEMEAALNELLAAEGLARAAVRNLATIDLKRDETGLLDFARRNGWPLAFYRPEELQAQIAAAPTRITPAAAVLKATGAAGVAEPAALLSSGASQLLIRKHNWKNVTLALTKANFTLSAQVRELPAT